MFKSFYSEVPEIHNCTGPRIESCAIPKLVPELCMKGYLSRFKSLALSDKEDLNQLHGTVL